MINMMMSNICALMRCDDAPFQPHSSSDFKTCMEIGTQTGNPFSYGHKLTKNSNQFDVFFCILFACTSINGSEFLFEQVTSRNSFSKLFSSLLSQDVLWS